MSFGSSLDDRHVATGDSQLGRLGRRLLVTGGCVAAGWIAASALGGTAHAATPDSIPAAATHKVSAQEPITGLLDEVRGAAKRLGQAASSVKPATTHRSITIKHTAHEHPRTTTISRSTVDSLDAAKLNKRLPAAITESLNKLKPVTDPVAQAAKDATTHLRSQTDQLTAPIAKTVTKTTDGLKASVTTVVQTVDHTVAAVLKPLQHTVADLQLPGLSAPVEARPAPPILASLAPVGGPATLHRAGTQSADGPPVASAAHRTHARSATGTRPAAVTQTRNGYAVAAQPATSAAAATAPARPATHPSRSRLPGLPAAPGAPNAPLGGNSGTGGGTVNTSGAGAAITHNSDAAAPLRSLGTVDPTDASMARRVSQRPSTSPD